MQTSNLLPGDGRRQARRCARLLALAALLAAGPGTTASRGGSVEFVEVRVKGRSPNATESGILRQDLRVAAGFVARTSLHLYVTEGRDVWERDVAPALADALKSGPEAVMRLPTTLPDSVASAGPNIDGGVVEFALPGGRGDGLIAIYLPDLLDRGGSDEGLLDAAKPNKGLYVAGVSVERDKDPSFDALYLPSRPKGMTRGSPPDVKVRELPGDGRGDLVIFRGKGGSGGDGDALRRDLSALLGRDRLTPSDLRAFPSGKDGLDRDLKTFRIDVETLEVDGGSYRTLTRDPRDWDFEDRRLAHPVRYLTFSAPVEVAGEGGRSALIVGGVALYAPLLLTARQAPLYINVSARAFAEAVHGGEVPFLREGDELYFHRAHLDRWKQGRALEGNGRAYGSKGAARRIEDLASEARSKGLGRAVGQPQPRRFQPSPHDAPDDSPPVRGRIFADDLTQWLHHYDSKADLPGSGPVFSLKSAVGGARFSARLGGGGGARAAPSRGAPALDMVDLYSLDPTCVHGQQVVASVGFVLDHIPDGEEATLTLEWSLTSGGPALARFSAEIVREAGEHEVHLEAGCPGERGTGTYEVILSWPATGLTVSRTTSVVSR